MSQTKGPIGIAKKRQQLNDEMAFLREDEIIDVPVNERIVTDMIGMGLHSRYG